MTSSLTDEPLGLSSNETAIHFSRAGTIFAAVSASIFTAVGIAGQISLKHLIQFNNNIDRFALILTKLY